MISKTITLKFANGSTETKTVFGPNEILLTKNILQLAKEKGATGFSTQSSLYFQGR